MGMYRHKMPDRELSEEMTKADYWEVQADMWHQNYKEAADEIERLREQCDRMASLAIDNAKDTERAMRLRKALREIYEVYANSEGIPQPMTAAEGYLLFLLKETAKIAQETLQEKE